MLDYGSSLFSNSSTLVTEYAKLGYNTDYGYWKGSNGSLYSFSYLNKQDNGKFLRGVQGYRNSKNWAYRRFEQINNVGKAFGYADIALTGGQLLLSPSEKKAWKFVDSAVSFFGPVLNTIGTVLLAPIFIEQNIFDPYNQVKQKQ